MEINLKYIANLAGVSVSTVSRALRGDPRVHPDTRDRIKLLAAKLNYVPNQAAIGLVTGKTKTIGLILPNIRTFMHDILDGIEEVCSRSDYNILLGVSNNDVEKEIRELKHLLQKRVDGLILFHISGMYDQRVVELSKDSGIPMIFIDRIIPGTFFDCIVNNNYLGSKLLVDNLYERGHRKIALIYEKEDVSTMKERIEGFTTAVVQKGLTVKPEYLVTSEFHKKKNGYESMIQISGLKDPPTAIIGSTGDNIYGIFRYFMEHPELINKYTLAGFDNSEYLDILTIPVTSLDLREREIGRNAAEVLEMRMKNKSGPKQTIVLDPIIVKRI